jgi:hypothetical protein
MAPPPSQKGKFKPRKPAKKANKVTVGSTVGVTPPTAATAAAAVAPPAAAAASPASKKEMPPRARGRPPVPQGQVFFTGNNKPAAAPSVKKRSTSAAASRKKSPETSSRDGASARKPIDVNNDDNDNNEEVIGTLDRSIGALVAEAETKKKSSGKGPESSSSASKKKDPLESMDMMDFEEDPSIPASRRSTSGFGMDGFYYDSDSSSDDDGERNNRRRVISNIRPTTLPFRPHPAPAGVGGKDQSEAYTLNQIPKESQPGDSLDQMDLGETENYSSPFVDGSLQKDLKWERDSWFLVQLPTRLPPLQQSSKRRSNASVKPPEIVSSNDDVTQAQLGDIDEVVTKPVSEDSFDNTLKTAAPGRIGKIKVYKSGKAVLVMEGSDPANKVRGDIL